MNNPAAAFASPRIVVDSVFEDVALATLGAKHLPWPETCIVREMRVNGRLMRKPTFYFPPQEISIDYPAPAKVSLDVIRGRFYSADYAAKHPADPVTILRALFRRREEIKVAILENRPLENTVTANGQLCFETTNSKLAASLYACGARHTPPNFSNGIPEAVLKFPAGQRLQFLLPEPHEMSVSEAAAKWADRDFYRSGSNHPLAYCRQACVNFDATLDFLNKVLPHYFAKGADIGRDDVESFLIRPQFVDGQWTVKLPDPDELPE